MIKKVFPAVACGAALFLPVVAAQAAGTLAANCKATDSTALISMDYQGKGSVKASFGGAEFTCGLTLEQLSGPPFSESMTGMLALTFDREKCDNAAGNRRVMREISLHIEGVLDAAATGMTMVQRRPVMYECKVSGFDLPALRKLVQSNTAITIKSDAP